MVIYNGIEFDSEEERLFYLYLDELKERGFVREFSFHKLIFNLSDSVKSSWEKKLKTKTKQMESTLLHPHVYTPDFHVKWETSSYGIFYCYIDDEHKFGDVPFISNKDDLDNDIGSYIEIKPSFDMNNMTRLFTINQKWVYKEHGIYVQKIIPNGKSTCLFAKTFVPQEAMVTPKRRTPKKFKFRVKSLNEFLGGFNE